MAKLTGFMISTDAQNQQVSPDKIQQIIIEPINTIIVKYIPTLYSIVVSVGISMLKESDNFFQLQVSLNNKVLVDTGEQAIPETSPTKKPNGMNFTLNIRNLDIQDEGDLIFSIKCGKKIIGTFNVPVLKGTE